MSRLEPRPVTVEFESEGAILRGLLFEATVGEPPSPIVVMAHGTTAMVYDHRNFGSSDGDYCSECQSPKAEPTFIVTSHSRP